MSIGQHTYWIVVDLHTEKAVTPENDWRRAYQFATEAYARQHQRILTKQEKEKAGRMASYDTGRYIVVKVPA